MILAWFLIGLATGSIVDQATTPDPVPVNQTEQVSGK